MNLLIVSPHSFVDLITNSSSELFVCETTRSVESVKDVLIGLAELYNLRSEFNESGWYSGKIDLTEIFTTVFQEPTASEWNFNPYHSPNWTEFCDIVGDRLNLLSFHHPVLAVCRQKLKEWETKNKPAPLGEAPTFKERLRHVRADRKFYADRQDVIPELFADWQKLYLKVHRDLYEWAAKENGVDLSPLGELKVDGGEWAWVYYDGLKYGDNDSLENSDAGRLINQIESCLSWGYTVKKGDIFIRSADDNSVPYGFFSDIEQAFGHVTRIHCG